MQTSDIIMGSNDNVMYEFVSCNVCHAMCGMQTCQGSARYRIREIFLNVLLSLREEGTLHKSELYFTERENEKMAER